MGYSTLGSRIAKNRYSPLLGAGEPIKISDKELAIIKNVLTKARDLERAIQIRSEYVYSDKTIWTKYVGTMCVSM